MNQQPWDREHLAENLDALSRDIQAIEGLVDAALGDTVGTGEALEAVASQPGSLGYADLTAYNRTRRASLGWGEADLAALLSRDHTAALHRWRAQDRLPWTAEDLVVMGFAGAVGVLAATLDTQVDARVRQGLGWLRSTDMFRDWEVDAARLSIDYTGRHFGGPAHRVRSAGHDVLRLVEALNQVRNGTFRGVRWDHGEKIVEQLTTNQYGKAFNSVQNPLEALALLLKHWAADIVTPMSLPFPGWSWLYELPSRDLRIFAHKAYDGLGLGGYGTGLNFRSGVMTPTLAVFSTEVIVRTHIHSQAYRDSGTPQLDAALRRKRSEMLLASHSIAAAASLTKTATMYVAYGPLSVRHINVPVLLRTGFAAAELQRDRLRSTVAGEESWLSIAEQELATLEESELWRLAAILEEGVSDVAD